MTNCSDTFLILVNLSKYADIFQDFLTIPWTEENVFPRRVASLFMQYLSSERKQDYFCVIIPKLKILKSSVCICQKLRVAWL